MLRRAGGTAFRAAIESARAPRGWRSCLCQPRPETRAEMVGFLKTS